MKTILYDILYDSDDDSQEHHGTVPRQLRL